MMRTIGPVLKARSGRGSPTQRTVLAQARTPVHDDGERRVVLRFSNQEVIIALTFAGLVNMAMVIMAHRNRGGVAAQCLPGPANIGRGHTCAARRSLSCVCNQNI
jgi:hypothetical protein